jgi:hypothetical protein
MLDRWMPVCGPTERWRLKSARSCGLIDVLVAFEQAPAGTPRHSNLQGLP